MIPAETVLLPVNWEWNLAICWKQTIFRQAHKESGVCTLKEVETFILVCLFPGSSGDQKKKKNLFLVLIRIQHFICWTSWNWWTTVLIRAASWNTFTFSCTECQCLKVKLKFFGVDCTFSLISPSTSSLLITFLPEQVASGFFSMSTLTVPKENGKESQIRFISAVAEITMSHFELISKKYHNFSSDKILFTMNESIFLFWYLKCPKLKIYSNFVGWASWRHEVIYAYFNRIKGMLEKCCVRRAGSTACLLQTAEYTYEF